MKKLLIAALASIALAAGAGTANASYYGGWYYNDDPGDGYEVLALGDSSDGTYRYLRGTSRYCGRPGASYATMRRVLNRSGDDGISWWVNHSCDDGYVRVCVENWRGESACSTYWDGGWQ